MGSKVSVVIPVKDRLEPLLRALKSVENQSFKDLEVIVVDDHSSIDVAGFVESHPIKTPLRFVRSLRHGVSAARNTGILLSRGEWIALLDSDDEWLPEKLQKQTSFVESHDVPLVHTEEIWIRNGVRVNQMKKHQKSGGRIFKASTKMCLISPSSVMIKKKLFDEVGLFDESFVVCEDYELWLRITSRYEVGFIEEALTVKYGGHEDQLSKKYHSMDLWRLRALKNYVSSQLINDTERQAVIHEIETKANILLNGFEKHQNFEYKDEVQSILKLAE